MPMKPLDAHKCLPHANVEREDSPWGGPRSGQCLLGLSKMDYHEHYGMYHPMRVE